MTATIQIRNVPEALHRRLKARAAMEGVSMSRYVLQEIERSLERPTRRERREAIAVQPERVLNHSPAEVLREQRGRR